MVSLAEFLRTEMETKHLSQSELARRIDVTPDYVRRWINGDIPRPEKCAQVADNLGVPRSTVLRMAGYPVDEQPDADPEWEVMQRELRAIYESWDRSRWRDLLDAHRAVANLARSGAQSSMEEAAHYSDGTSNKVDTTTQGTTQSSGFSGPAPSLLLALELSAPQGDPDARRSFLREAEDTLHRAWLLTRRPRAFAGAV